MNIDVSKTQQEQQQPTIRVIREISTRTSSYWIPNSTTIDSYGWSTTQLPDYGFHLSYALTQPLGLAKIDKPTLFYLSLSVSRAI